MPSFRISSISHGPFTDLLSLASAALLLGPQFVGKALGHPNTDKLRVHFFDNTDPDGIDYTYPKLENLLAPPLPLVISKSGGTPETRNGCSKPKMHFPKGIDFLEACNRDYGRRKQTSPIFAGKRMARFSTHVGLGGRRTSETAAVGLLPAALQGIDIDQLLAGPNKWTILPADQISGRTSSHA